MNIKNRIKKLEDGASNSGNCECKNVRKVETYTQDLTEDAEDTEPHMDSDPVPETCTLCGKPIEKQIIIVQLVDAPIKESLNKGD